MDDQTRALLLAAFQFLHGQEEQISDLQIVTHAVRETIRELGPEAEKIYGKHYLAGMQSDAKKAGDATLASLAQLIRQLSSQNDQN